MTVSLNNRWVQQIHEEYMRCVAPVQFTQYVYADGMHHYWFDFVIDDIMLGTSQLLDLDLCLVFKLPDITLRHDRSTNTIVSNERLRFKTLDSVLVITRDLSEEDI